MARRLLPAALVLPPVIGWARLLGEQSGLYGLGFGLALFATANAVTFTALVLWNTHSFSPKFPRASAPIVSISRVYSTRWVASVGVQCSHAMGIA